MLGNATLDNVRIDFSPLTPGDLSRNLSGNSSLRKWRSGKTKIGLEESYLSQILMGLPEETVLTTTGKRKKKKKRYSRVLAIIRVELQVIDQHTAFRHAQRTTLQSNDFNLRVKC